jgi:16S rRNA processing protein RimM
MTVPKTNPLPPDFPWLEIGTVVAAQGLKGELRVRSSSDFPERFEQPGERWLQDPQGLNPPQSVQLLSGRYLPSKNIYIVKLADVGDRTQAESLRGYRFLVPESDRPSLGEDEYHIADLIGLDVYHQTTGEPMGTITALIEAGNDLLEVTLPQQDNLPSGKAYIPFVKAIVPLVDLEGKRIEILPPLGLLEL